jgi:uncharacterized membrane protein
MAGLTQFSPYLQKNRKIFHRWMGYLYVIDVLVMAGPSGFILGMFANGGLFAKVSFMLLSILWILFTAKAVLEIRKGHHRAHQVWMIRSYALTLSAISLRLFAWILPRLIQLPAVELYTLIAWLSWTVNLLLAEVIVLSCRRRNMKPDEDHGFNQIFDKKPN